MRRREFLGTSALLLFEAQAACTRPPQSQAVLKDSGLREELSEAEIAIVNRSAMAKDLDNFFGKGYS
jgi:hypothetical protein